MDTSVNGFGAATPAADFHVEYLYGPQWPAVVVLIERAALLMAEERGRLDAAAREMNAEIAALTGFGSGGLTRLLSNAGRQAGTALEIAAQTAKDYGRFRNVHTAGLVVGQVVSPETDTTDLTTLLQSFGSVGRLAVVRQAVTATILQDLVGHGRFSKAVHEELMTPWRTAIGG